uniref:Serine protease 16 n=1 Tax=Loxodonta africana TaxID=9785 RepID=G3UHL7_LOXAF
RYFINDAFYKPGGPVFLMIGGMETAKRNWISRNLPFIAYAERLHALCLVLEHRFYGHSQPTGDLSTASLRYIRNHQVLGDIVNFRIKIAKLMGLTKNKWVAFGEFYGGSLAVWSRIKYPDLFAAAVGSSAPVKVKINFDEYFEGVQTSLDASNIKCSRAVQRALLEVIRMLKSPKSYSILKSDFMLCETPQNKSSQHIPFVLENLMSFLIPIVQYNKKRKSVMGVVSNNNILSIDDFCDKMTETPLSSPYHRYARIVRNNIRNRNLSCLDANYNHRLRRLSETSLDKGNVDQARQRLYQCCTEFGFFQSTDSRYQPFSELPIRYFLDKCSDLFGSEYSFSSLRQSAEALNSYYGGFNVNGSKIIFSSGSLDPWNALGITRDISKNLRAVLIEG